MLCLTVEVKSLNFQELYMDNMIGYNESVQRYKRIHEYDSAGYSRRKITQKGIWTTSCFYIKESMVSSTTLDFLRSVWTW